MTMPEHARPKVGVGVIVHDEDGRIVMGERRGAHGAGTYQLPGGHLEHGESFAATAIREVFEETGLVVGRVKFLTATNDVFEKEGKHYVTVFVSCVVIEGEGVPRTYDKVMEPEKCAKWEWVPWRQMWAWARAQAVAEDEAEVQGKAKGEVEVEVERKMFLPLVNLVREYPELETRF